MIPRFAIVFPGQGSQSLGMLADLSSRYSEIRRTFNEASDTLNYDLWTLTQEGPEEKLNQTEYTQPVMLAADVAVYRCWQSEQNFVPQYMAGHSLGEYSALVCAQALDFVDAVQLVAKRGRCMQQAVAPGVGAMAAIIGLEVTEVAELCFEAEQANEIVKPANFNAIGQTVIGGHRTAVERALSLAKQKGAKLAKLIPVSVPSHCPLMQEAADCLTQDLKKVAFYAPQIPVIHNSNPTLPFIHSELTDEYSPPKGDRIREILIEQLISPVRWVETIQFIANQGIQIVIECGPGNILAGLQKRITPLITTFSIGQPEQFNSALAALKG